MRGAPLLPGEPGSSGFPILSADVTLARVGAHLLLPLTWPHLTPPLPAPPEGYRGARNREQGWKGRFPAHLVIADGAWGGAVVLFMVFG